MTYKIQTFNFTPLFLIFLSNQTKGKAENEQKKAIVRKPAYINQRSTSNTHSKRRSTSTEKPRNKKHSDAK